MSDIFKHFYTILRKTVIAFVGNVFWVTFRC